MRRVLILAFVAAFVLGWAATDVMAGSQDDAVIALHAQLHPQKGGDPCVMDAVCCSDFVTQWPLFSSADVYLVVAKGNPNPGVAALSCGILYNNGEMGASTKLDQVGVDLYSWTLCTSGLEFTNSPTGDTADEWPASGGGNRITWNAQTDCQVTECGGDGVHALAGSFYVYAYSDDVFQVIENRNLEGGVYEFQVGDCTNAVSDIPWPQAAGAVGFGAGAGYNPCTAVPVQTSTWGKIKTQY